MVSSKSSIKRNLIMQSLLPLFLFLFVKYFDFKLCNLAITFVKICRISPIEAITKSFYHPLFITSILECICLSCIVVSLLHIKSFSMMQTANFVSQGETITDIKETPDSDSVFATFFVIYTFPMFTNNLNSVKGLIVLAFLLWTLLILMWKTNLYYQNPVLVILGYNTFSFRFETTQLKGFTYQKCIGITKGTIHKGKSVKRQRISDNVFLIYEDIH